MTKKNAALIIFVSMVIITLILAERFRVLLPPITAIGLALITHEVIFSLFCGIWIGAVIVLDFSNLYTFFESIFIGLFKTADTYIIGSLNDSSHLMIVLFTLFIGGLVGVIARSGGLIGIVNKLSRHTNSAMKAQLTTWFLGITIFFDDYANALIVGNTMRPITDKFKVSREKLAYIIDSTAAPVSSLALLSTWIGYEVGLIGDVMKNSAFKMDPYMAFIYSLPYRFYAILLLIGIPIFIMMKRDYSTMFEAEKRATLSGEVVAKDEIPFAGEEIATLVTPPLNKCHWYNAVLPILSLIIATLVGFYITGLASLTSANSSNIDVTIRSIVANADSLKSLLWASLFSSLFTILLIRVQKIDGIKNSIASWIKGAKSMMMAVFILALAWGMGMITKELKTAEYLCEIFSDKLPLFTLPALVFIMASIISFATGTSWGTMAILFPISIPLVEAIGLNQAIPLNETTPILFATIGSVLTGAVFGDHCSPISDTTIMSSLSSQVDHIDHVRTQIPYAVTFGIISIIFGYLPAGFGVNPYALIVIQLILLVIFIQAIGRKLPVSKAVSS